VLEGDLILHYDETAINIDLFVPAACTQDEVNKCVDSAKAAQKIWAKTPLWKRAETLHRFAAILREHSTSIASCLVKEIAKCQKDSVTEVREMQRP
jgi:glyceraldehyde-3-phosphate dehydrogenase (NADP+)